MPPRNLSMFGKKRSRSFFSPKVGDDDLDEDIDDSVQAGESAQNQKNEIKTDLFRKHRLGSLKNQSILDFEEIFRQNYDEK